MRKRSLLAASTAALAAAALAVPVTAPQAGAVAPSSLRGTVPAVDEPVGTDNLSRPWRSKYEQLRQAALEQRLRSGGSGAVERVGKGQYGKVAQSGTDKVFVILAEFGNREHPLFPDGDSDATTFDGPRHNQIPKPDRSVDNTTIWQPDYDRAHYEDMYFDRMRRFYERQSTGRYSIEGEVTEWVKVPFNQARYGRNDCGDNVCANTWALIRDGLAYWVEAQLESGRTMAQVRRYLRTFDRQDRYDFDEDGDFAEPDGYIDHFQVVHAGGDEAAGDPIYNSDAIWSHRWNAQVRPVGTGPAGGAQIGGVNAGQGAMSGGVRIPGNPTGVWVNDYTIQPENGGLGVFAHEFAHDLGLDDLYDTAGGENSTAFWSLMSQGSYGNRVWANTIGEQPLPLTAWERFQLGWLDYDVARAGRTSKHSVRPLGSADGTRRQAVAVLLPDKHVPLALGDPCAGCGQKYFYSGSGNNLDSTMTLEVDAGGEVTAQVRYEIEDGWDYAFLEASTDAGSTWESVETSVSYEGEDLSGLNPTGTGISGTTDGQWVNLSATVPAQTDMVRFRYMTDGAYALSGFQVDQITVGGQLVGSAEEAEGWELDGFRTTTGSEDQTFLNAYFVENRQYVGNDRSLRGAYNFRNLDTRPDWVEKFPYQNGMLVWYWDTSHTDNNVSEHPGSGMVLPVDAHPVLVHNPDATLARIRIQSYDSTFGLERTDPIRLHYFGEPFGLRSQPAVPVFNDRLDWWYRGDEHGTPHPGTSQPGWVGVDVPKTGTKIRLLKTNKAGVITVGVR